MFLDCDIVDRMGTFRILSSVFFMVTFLFFFSLFRNVFFIICFCRFDSVFFCSVGGIILDDDVDVVFLVES